jgi:hypothetical protein
VTESQKSTNLQNLLLQFKSLRAPQVNAQEQQRKAQGVETGQPILVEDVIYTKKNTNNLNNKRI